jgi:DNA-binding transcriptional LysR family regulator
MHVETLKTFCDLIETGSLSGAAKLHRVTQSAVSQQLRALEQRFGRRLVDRAPHVGARPTEAGRILYDELLPILDRLGAVERRLRERPNVVAGIVRIATVYSVGLHTLPRVMKKSLAAHPALHLRVEYRRTDQVSEACLRGEVDLGIVALPAKRAQLEVVPLGHDELVLVVAPDHPLAKQKRVRVRDLDGAPFVAFDRDIPTRRFVDRLLRRHGANVVLTMELDNIETIKRSVEAGIGVSMLPLPALAAEVRAKSLVVKKLDASPIERPLGVLHRKNRELSRGAQVFLKLLATELGGG